ncbi:MAG: N-acetylmuramoyl-L-alanine amidase [Magnetococcales bacterium]|nr:N-acetylmuramoyl-L-alanine amidase [Magnetococcales bacterium]
MTYSLTWLARTLENAGLKVAEVPGWENRGRAEMGTVKGVICHHTAGSRNGNMPSLRVLIEGRSDLPGPLSQLGLGRDGTFYVIAAGRCNHAGAGRWMDERNGNSCFIGIEAENTGQADDPWPEVQMNAYVRGVAAILKHLNRSAEYCAGHKEYALPLGRKPDPNFPMEPFREKVQALLNNWTAPTLIPATTDDPIAPRPTLRRTAQIDMATKELVQRVQKVVGVDQDGHFGPHTEAAVRAFQKQHDLVPDGIVGPKTWAKIDAMTQG